jgi:hypothetical protein
LYITFDAFTLGGKSNMILATASKIKFSQMHVANVCNPLYSGVRDQKDLSSKPAQPCK